MPSFVGISGSLRAGSFNTGILRAAAAVMPSGCTLAVESIRGIPLYDADAEAATGIPPRVAELKDRIASSDGLIIATPEYNNSIPGVLKNATDWLTRPPTDSKRVFSGRAVALLGATPGGLGTVLAQDAWLPILRALGCRPWFGGRLLISKAPALFDAQGNLTDEATRKQIQDFVAGFAAFASGGASR